MTGTPETFETRLKRARIRAWRRGTREMDLLLGGYFDAHGPGFDEPALATFERLMGRGDPELYAAISNHPDRPLPDASAAETALIDAILRWSARR